MDTNLNPQHYHENHFFELEQKHIFKKNWFFAGFLSDLKNENDWIAGEYAGIPYTIQNVDGENLRGFINKCSHRHSLIRTENSGRGCLICPYHGWRYDNHGTPSAIPCKPKFNNLNEEQTLKLSLKPINTETCGNLVFASFDCDSGSLKECSGFLYEDLFSLSTQLGRQVGTHRYTVQANWKFIQEIALEAYHVNFVHQNTFAKHNFLAPDIHIGNKASAFSLATSDNPTNKRKIDHLFPDRPNRHPGYYHLTLFPTFNISTLFGALYAVVETKPLSANSSEFVVHMFQCPSTEVDFIREIKKNEYFKMSFDFSDKLNIEDLAIVESQQKGIAHSTSRGILSMDELRISHFHNLLLTSIQSN